MALEESPPSWFTKWELFNSPGPFVFHTSVDVDLPRLCNRFIVFLEKLFPFIF